MEKSTTTTTVPIKGMTCMGCVNSVKTVLEKLPGVIKVTVLLDDAQAIIEHQVNTSGIADFTRAIQEAGFDVS